MDRETTIFSFRRFGALFTQPLVARYGLLVFLLLLVVLVVRLAVNDSAETTALRRGDFPAFWSMAVIAQGAESERLYDIELQRQVQNAAWPSLAGAMLPAVYPAHVALIVRPLARFDHRTARSVWSVVSLAAVLVGVLIVVRCNSQISWAPWMVLGVLFMFSPFLRGVMGGQVLSFMVPIYAIALACSRAVSLRANVLFGIVLGVWLFKPYYAVCALFVPMLQRRWVSLAVFALVTAISWQLGSSVVGPGWVSQWEVSLQHFAEMNIKMNAHQMPNMWAQVYRLCGGAGELGVSWWVALAGTYGALALGVLAIVGRKTIRKMLRNPVCNGDLLLHLTVSLTIVAMPQVNFYDLGLLACAVVALFDPRQKADRVFVILCLVAAQSSFRVPFGVPLHFLLSLAGLAFICYRVRALVEQRSP